VPGAAGQGSYPNAATSLASALDAQIAYLIERAASPALEDASWRQFASQAAQNVKSLAADVERLSPPACLASAHAGLVQAARQASASNSGQVSQAGSAFGVARASLGQAADAVRSASC
jgi:hypothetical protein